ncbi:hypothetical protein MHU86_15550 [Fragilaria crotonensis]|nr:hypothetical protein MHU86_15550 [Fragilaria crotonensis]
MNVISVAIVSTNNTPLFLKDFRDEESSSSLLPCGDIPEAELFGLKTITTSTKSGGSTGTDGFSSRAKECSLRQQFILHAALDRFEELAGPPPGVAWRQPGAYGADAMWVGLLCPVEEMRVYGYMTTSKLKLMAVVEDTLDSFQGLQGKLLEDEVKQLFIRIHELLVEYTLNPFNPIDGRKFSSPSFDKRVSDTVRQFNRTV